MFGDLSTASTFFLLIAVGLALSFEFVNGFHDTANAVATVIYTHSLRPTVAVIWSAIWNLVGVMVSGGAVAFGVLALLPVELILNVGSAAGFAMVFSLLVSAIIWNLGTWYFGLPASSSHTLIGSIMGVGLANAMHHAGSHFGEGVNWAKAQEVGLTLMFSPLIGFFAAGGLLLLMKLLWRRPELYQEPAKGQAPPLWIRAILISTCSGVSFAHGSNDGQKGMGLILLILIGILPGQYAINQSLGPAAVEPMVAQSRSVQAILDKHAQGNSTADSAADELSAYLKVGGKLGKNTIAALAIENRNIGTLLTSSRSIQTMDRADRGRLRSAIYLVSDTISKLIKSGEFPDTAERAALASFTGSLEPLTQYLPPWVKSAVAIALGLGTMVGWQRIVITVGEKIGKTHLSYAQGAAAEVVAAATIGAAGAFGLPVSTTHVLSSGVAGTMAANHSGLQMNTLRNLLVAWVLTLPVCVFLGALLFSLGLNVVISLGLK